MSQRIEELSVGGPQERTFLLRIERDERDAFEDSTAFTAKYYSVCP